MFWLWSWRFNGTLVPRWGSWFFLDLEDNCISRSSQNYWFGWFLNLNMNGFDARVFAWCGWYRYSLVDELYFTFNLFDFQVLDFFICFVLFDFEIFEFLVDVVDFFFDLINWYLIAGGSWLSWLWISFENLMNIKYPWKTQFTTFTGFTYFAVGKILI
jgi:hypothetical protein